MKRIRIFLVLFTICSVWQVNAQQLPQYSQYMLNDFIINPAITGSKDHFRAISNNRYQWLGIVDAPRTYTLSVYGPHKHQPMGFGGFIYQDVTGPTSRLGAQAAYSYQFKASDALNISLGLSAGFMQYKIDATKITFHDVEVNIQDNMYTDYLPDASFGVYAYGDNYYGGVSVNQLFNNRIKVAGTRAESETNLVSQINLMGGYRYDINETFSIEPSVLVRYELQAPFAAELNAKVIYNKYVWGGISYRYDDAVSVLIGYEILEQIYFAYAYDFSTSAIRNHSSGTHEIMIGARFNKYKQELE